MTSKKQLGGGGGSSSGGGGSTNYARPLSSTMKRYGKGGDQKEIFRKGPWTPEEDALLMQYVQRHGERHWNSVQKTGLMRCGKSCRLRWTNHLRPDLKKGAFTAEEERVVLDLHDKLGNKWSKIAAQLPGRTDNEVKNFWNTKIKRKMRAKSLQNNNPQLLHHTEQTEPLQSLNPIESNLSDHTINPNLFSPSQNSNTNPDFNNPSSSSLSVFNPIHAVNSSQDPILSFLNNPAYNNKYNNLDFHHHQQHQQNCSVLSDPFQFSSSSGISRFHLSPASSPSANYFNPSPFLTNPSTQFDYGSPVPTAVSNYDSNPNNLFQFDSSRPPTLGMMGTHENTFMELPSFQNASTMTKPPTATPNTASYIAPYLLPSASGNSFSNGAGMTMRGDKFSFLQGEGLIELDHSCGSGSSGAVGNLSDCTEVKFKKDLTEGVEAMDDDELRNLLDTFSSIEPTSTDWFHHHTNATTRGGVPNMGDPQLLEDTHHGNVVHNFGVPDPPSAALGDHLQGNAGGCHWNNMPGMR